MSVFKYFLLPRTALLIFYRYLYEFYIFHVLRDITAYTWDTLRFIKRDSDQSYQKYQIYECDNY